jgi:putative phosphonate metabolism protein
VEALRHAIYWVPAPGPLASFGAAWLGWDAGAGREVPQPDLWLPRPLERITAEPRRYGLHATLKAPFRLAAGATTEALGAATAGLARTLAPARSGGLRLARVGGFLALVPGTDEAALARLAAAVVAGLDRFRAPADEAEIARRRAPGLSAAEEANLTRWGYPYVMDAFRFHVTLTGALAPGEAPAAEAALAPRLRGLLPDPFVLDALSHVGEGGDGRFRVLGRYPLGEAGA